MNIFLGVEFSLGSFSSELSGIRTPIAVMHIYHGGY